MEKTTGIKVVGRRALIGRGFLGQTLDKPGRWTDRYHSKNIHEMSGQYDFIVIAAPSAEKWRANQFPQVDNWQMGNLVEGLLQVQADRVVLLSTIDASRIGPYGQHRRALEGIVEGAFPGSSILRLPALYGDGLKKNALYDLLQGKQIANQVYHWYPTVRLWDDVKAAASRLTCLYSAPLSMWEIAERLGLTDLVTQSCDPRNDYMEPVPYTMTSQEVLEEIVTWAKSASL